MTPAAGKAEPWRRAAEHLEAEREPGSAGLRRGR
jgi:hypothetical protein